MKKVFINISSFISVLSFCVEVSLKTSRKYFLIRFFLDAIAIPIPFIIVTLNSSLIDFLVVNTVNTSEINTIVRPFLILSLSILGFSILSRTIETLKTYYEGLLRETIDSTLKHLIMKKSAELDLSFFDSSTFYNEMSDANVNSPLISQYIFQILDMILHFIQFIIAFVILLDFNNMLAFVFIVSIIPCTIIQLKQLEAVYSFQKEHIREERKMQYAADVLVSQQFAKDVRIYNLFSFISDKYISTWKTLFTNKRNITQHYTKILVIISTFPEIITVIILFTLGFSVINGTSTLGYYSYFHGIMTQILGGIYMMIFNYTQLVNGKMRIQNYLKFMQTQNKMQKSNALLLVDPTFSIEFRDVSFRYDDSLAWVLKNVSFTIHSQQKVALVGANGSGKSTIVKLLLRFYDPVEGQILINGRDIREYESQSVRRRFSTVFQDYCNYAFTIKESISLSNINNADDNVDISKVLKQSRADMFVDKFPFGVDTYLTRKYDDSGHELSEGQWQKIAIARALFHKADVYILDEPSASLDAESEDAIFSLFQTQCAGKGTILISHRLSNIHLANIIFVLDNGSIVQSGRHNELMKTGGLYADMYRLQTQKYDYIQSKN